VSAQVQGALVAVAGPTPEPNADDWPRELVSTTLRFSPVTAGQRIAIARSLTTELPATLSKLDAGEISYRHACVIVEECSDLDPANRALVEARVLLKAGDQTIGELRRAVRRAVIAAAPEVAQIKRAVAAEDRNVQHFPAPDGMATLVAHGPAEDVYALYLAADALARKGAADDAAAGLPFVKLDARRFDAFLAMALTALADPSLPKAHGRPVQVQFAIGLDSLLGMSDEPAELLGYGSIPSSVVRMLAGDAAWQRLVVDPVTGHLLDFGTLVYRPPQELKDFLVARDQRCMFPGCAAPAIRCDIDHRIPHSKGGRTSSKNCGPLCRRHHRLKTHGGWLVEFRSDGSVMWTSPTGQRFIVEMPSQVWMSPEPRENDAAADGPSTGRASPDSTAA
jgi:hypothetical protein